VAGVKALIGVLSLLVLGGTGGAFAWQAFPSEGERAADERAEALFEAMETYRGTTAWDQARQASRYGHVRILVARDTVAGREIVLAVRAVREPTNTLFAPEPYDVTQCYRWTAEPHRPWGAYDQTDCPTQKHIERESAETNPVPETADAALKRVLRSHDDAAEVRAALARVDDFDGLYVEVAGVDGTLGVAVLGIEGYASGRRVNDCLRGRRDGKRVEVWRPSDIEVAPGEGGCDPRSRKPDAVASHRW